LELLNLRLPQITVERETDTKTVQLGVPSLLGKFKRRLRNPSAETTATKLEAAIAAGTCVRPMLLSITRLRDDYKLLHRDNRAGADAQNPGMNLHVSGLSHSVTADDLQKYFSTVGEVSYLWSQTRRFI
jgi:hypothetical protein